MTDQDYIRAGVEMADGYRWLHRDQVEIPDLNNPVLRPFEQQWFLDALAEQLVRQVDAVGGIVFDLWADHTGMAWGDQYNRRRSVNGPDRTMNTIKCIVDSKVLK